MCEDSIYARVSVRTVLDACSAHIRNSNCAPSFSYVKELVRLVMGSLSGVSLCQHLKSDKDEQVESKGGIQSRSAVILPLVLLCCNFDKGER